MKHTIFFSIFLLLQHLAFSQKIDEKQNIIIGKIDSVQSKILGEQRKIWVYVPDDAANLHRYPVVYVLDGDGHFSSVVGMIQQLSTGGNNLCPKMIVVGIPNTDRTRDLTPTHIDADPPFMDSTSAKTSGGGENFIAFIGKELMPYIETKYPTAPYKMFIGHSFGGLAVMQTFVHHNHLFNSYICIDPSMWWDNQKLLTQTQNVLAEKKYSETSFYLGIANTLEEGMEIKKVPNDTSVASKHIRSILTLQAAFEKNKQNGLKYGSKYYPDDSHGSVPLITEYDAFRFFFDFFPLKLSMKDYMDSAGALANKYQFHFADLSQKMGYQIKPDEGEINFIGYDFLGRKIYKTAESLFKLNIKNYPESFNVYDAYADFFIAKKDTANAITQLKKALALKENPGSRQKVESLEGRAENSQKQKTNQPIQLEQLLQHYSKEYYALNPLEATQAGINDYNNQIEITISEAHIKKAKALNQKYLTQLAVINKAGLTASELLSIDVLTYKLKSENERLNNSLGFYRPVDQFVFSFSTRFATLGSGAGFVPFTTEKDYRDFISRMKGFQVWVDQAIANMKKGVEQNNTNPKASMEKVPAQLKPLFEGVVQENVFYKPLLKIPNDLDSLAAIQLKKDYSAAIENIIQPAYKKLHDYIVTDYIPKARKTSGLLDNDKGKKEYELWLKHYTTTTITAEQIFNLGLREVARIRKEMDSVKKIVGFKGDLRSFFEYVKTDPKFFPFKTEDEVLDRYRSFLDKMSPQLNILFNLKPKAKFEVRATEKFRAAGANAQYMTPSRDGKRPGIFYEVIHDPAQYNYFSMEDLFIHEAIPGHHYQTAIQQEADIPEFRKAYWTSAFGEGWALYAESLGNELGMYTDPYQYLGRLNGEIERAVRLVVDAGIHYKGWSREKAIVYVLDNQPVSSVEAEQRIERYMVTAGQAVSYKVGELKIIELRERAKKKLGNKFDIKEFHDEVLKDGCLPLVILETKINRWIESKAAKN